VSARDDETTIHVCQGPPRCDLMDDEAMAAQVAGCPWCRRIYVNDKDGSERIEEPAET
jgi:hypothetical protein